MKKKILCAVLTAAMLCACAGCNNKPAATTAATTTTAAPAATDAPKALCQQKLNVLLEQQKDLSEAIDQLLNDIAAGRKYMKVYKQMKMYNDPSTNPILYGKK